MMIHGDARETWKHSERAGQTSRARQRARSYTFRILSGSFAGPERPGILELAEKLRRSILVRRNEVRPGGLRREGCGRGGAGIYSGEDREAAQIPAGSSGSSRDINDP